MKLQGVESYGTKTTDGQLLVGGPLRKSVSDYTAYGSLQWGSGYLSQYSE
jgi:hypothetical protein